MGNKTWELRGTGLRTHMNQRVAISWDLKLFGECRFTSTTTLPDRAAIEKHQKELFIDKEDLDSFVGKYDRLVCWVMEDVKMYSMPVQHAFKRGQQHWKNYKDNGGNILPQTPRTVPSMPTRIPGTPVPGTPVTQKRLRIRGKQSPPVLHGIPATPSLAYIGPRTPRKARGRHGAASEHGGDAGPRRRRPFKSI